MSRPVKRIEEECEVKTCPDSPLPYLFHWRGQIWKVRRVNNVYRKESKWWRPEGSERRTYYRCVVHTGKASRGGNTLVVLCLQEEEDEWR